LSIEWNAGDPVSEMIKPTILNFFSEHIIRTREPGWILQILEERYHFTDEDEQQQILSIVQSLLNGQQYDLPGVKDLPPREELIEDAFSVFFDNEMMFSYESFLQFRLKPYRDVLTEYVECAIDEYRLEQEYQEFVHQLRQFVKKRVSLFSTVYLIHECDHFTIYNQHFYQLQVEDINALLADYRDAFADTIASDLLRLLIVIAPTKIGLYTDHPDSAMNQTIQNIFQERVSICPYRQFQIPEQNSK
jgi:putative sporulation protein YtxC